MNLRTPPLITLTRFLPLLLGVLFVAGCSAVPHPDEHFAVDADVLSHAREVVQRGRGRISVQERRAFKSRSGAALQLSAMALLAVLNVDALASRCLRRGITCVRCGCRRRYRDQQPEHHEHYPEDEHGVLLLGKREMLRDSTGRWYRTSGSRLR